MISRTSDRPAMSRSQSAFDMRGAANTGEFSDRPMNPSPVARLSRQEPSMEMNMTSLADKNVIVLGASRGLGAMIARRAAAQGARTLAVARDRDRLDEFARNAGDVEVLDLDASDEGAPEKVFSDRVPSLLVIC